MGALIAAASAYAHESPTAQPAAATQSVPTSCPGAADSSFTDHKVITGEFPASLQGSYVLLPFDVPAGTTAVRVRYCHDQPDLPTNSQIKHVLDLGLYDAQGNDNLWDTEEFRGWGGSSHPDVTVAPNGFSSEAQYLAAPRTHVHGRTTRGFEPGPISTGQWAVELGVAAVASQAEGDADGKVAWRVQIDLSDDPSWADDQYSATPYDTTPAKSDPGWYAGDMHVHSEHSSLGDAPMTEVFDYAFSPFAAGPDGGAGLDFITLSDYVTDSAWGEIGRYQPDHPGKLIVRSSEVITYRGHANNHASLQLADYRTGPIHQRDGDGSLTQLRGPTPASDIFDAVHDPGGPAGGGFTQINHPTIFPSEVPGFDFLCRGCPWDYTNAETDYTKVDAIEVATGPAGLRIPPLDPGPNPFTPLAIQFYEDALGTGAKIAAVGSSDSHKAGRFNDLPDIPSSPVGQATTVVYADELSEKGIQRGVEAGHTYVKVFGNDGPDLRFEASEPGSSDPPAMMGDTIQASEVDFTARVIGAGESAARPGPYLLVVVKDGLPLLAAPVSGDDFSFPFSSLGPGRYRLQLHRLSGVGAIEAVSSPIYVEGPAPATSADLSVSKADNPDPATKGEELTYTLTAKNEAGDQAQNAKVTDVLPSSVEFVSATEGCAEEQGTVSCPLGDLDQGEEQQVQITVRPTKAIRLSNSAILSSDTPDPSGENNSDTEETDVSPVAGRCDGGTVGEDDQNDSITGTPDADKIRGLGGDDTIRGKPGRDCLNGDEDSDELHGGADPDELWGGPGDDEFFAVGGSRDTIHCGPGDDRVHAGRKDRVGASCERVTRGS
jgi:uncharacterized repeat protein (TIGR01451 family)